MQTIDNNKNSNMNKTAHPASGMEGILLRISVSGFEPLPASAPAESAPFFESMNSFIDSRPISDARKAHYRVLSRALRRFELYRDAVGANAGPLSFHHITSGTISEFADFLRNEHEIHARHPEIYLRKMDVVETVRRRKRSAPRGENTVSCMLKRLRTFLRWAEGKGYLEKNPFADFGAVAAEKYGRPYFLNVEELERVAGHDAEDLGEELATQRDIFVFQCLTGCRYGDLVRLKRDNIIEGAVEYIPSKTRGERPDTVRVPLTAMAARLVESHGGGGGEGGLFPFAELHKYNAAIRETLARCGVTRVVTVLDPVTRKEVRRPICEIASSHMARRTFVGNIYKVVKDPSLVGVLSGHKEGSRAFARYRDIDEDMKRELVSHLDFG